MRTNSRKIRIKSIRIKKLLLRQNTLIIKRGVEELEEYCFYNKDQKMDKVDENHKVTVKTKYLK